MALLEALDKTDGFHAMTSQGLFTDDTPVMLLAAGDSKTAPGRALPRVWDKQFWQGAAPLSV